VTGGSQEKPGLLMTTATTQIKSAWCWLQGCWDPQGCAWLQDGATLSAGSSPGPSFPELLRQPLSGLASVLLMSWRTAELEGDGCLWCTLIPLLLLFWAGDGQASSSRGFCSVGDASCPSSCTHHCLVQGHGVGSIVLKLRTLL